MPQEIVMSDDGQKDIDKIESIITDLMTFGILHEEMVWDIQYCFALQVFNDYENLLDVEKEEYLEQKDSNYDDFFDYLQQEEGSGFYNHVIFELTDVETRVIAKKFRDILSYYLSARDYLSPEEALEYIEEI